MDRAVLSENLSPEQRWSLVKEPWASNKAKPIRPLKKSDRALVERDSLLWRPEDSDLG